MNMHHQMPSTGGSISLALLFSFLCISLLALYLLLVVLSNKHYKKWSSSRTACWFVGMFCLWLSIATPIAKQTSFISHMICHLILGMLAPLLVVLSAPMTLVLRTLKTSQARYLTRLLKSIPIRFLTHPITAALFYIGGLVLLYTTNLFASMHQHFFIYLLVHFHLFLAGYLFTASIIYIDPTPHRYSFLYRSIVCLITLAAHAFLSKYIYAHPPLGVPLDQAETGAMVMYYGGDIIDSVLIYIFCYQWFYATRNTTKYNLSVE
jgi:putative membrane protein